MLLFFTPSPADRCDGRGGGVGGRRAVDDDDVLFDFFWARDIKEEKDPDGRDVTLIRHRRRARAHPSVPICDDAMSRVPTTRRDDGYKLPVRVFVLAA